MVTGTLVNDNCFDINLIIACILALILLLEPQVIFI